MSEPTPAACEQKPCAPVCGKKKKILSAVFNMAAGAVAAAVVKSAVVATMAWATAPAVATLLVSSVAVGAISTAFRHVLQVRQAKKNGLAAPKFLSKKTAKAFAKNSAFALVGGALFMGFSEGIFQSWFGSAPVEAAPPVVEAVVPVVELSALDRFHDVIAGQDISSRVEDAINRSTSTNLKVSAQGIKDLAYFTFNGFDGVPKDQPLAVELFHKAADLGNVQAKVDLGYIQYHGLGGVEASPQEALQTMQQLPSARAAWFVEQWGGAAAKKTAAAVISNYSAPVAAL